MKKIFLLLVLASTLNTHPEGAFGAESHWDLNDVSVLLPLPSDINDTFMFRANTTASAGELLPLKFFKLLPSLFPGADAFKILGQLRVVGIRIDPCFPHFSPSVSKDCRSQIRMVWQPLTSTRLGVTAMDMAVHSFYELTHSEFLALVKELLALKNKSGTVTKGLPLSIHPTILKQGLAGSYWGGLSELFLKYAGDKRLSQMTVMTLERGAVEWNFGGIEIVAGKPKPLVIPRVGTRIQSFINVANAKEGFSGGARPAPHGDDTFSDILEDSSIFSTANAAELRRSADSAHRIENPKIHSPKTVDCVSCHTAQSSRMWAIVKFPELDLGESRYKFISSHNLTNASPPSQGQAHILRAFGYFNRNFSVSPRTINESAAVADVLNAWLRK